MKMPLNLCKITGAAALTFSISLSNLHAFKVMASLNTYTKTRIEHNGITNAVHKVVDLNSDGIWFIDSQFSDLQPGQFGHACNLMGFPRITEDNPGSAQTYNTYFSVFGSKPTTSFCYNETGGTPGATVLNASQIDTQYASHGNKPLLVLTRSYAPGAWKNAVDGALNNPKVRGVVFEPVSIVLSNTGFANNHHQNIIPLIDAVMNKGKELYILIHGGGDYDPVEFAANGISWGDALAVQAVANLTSRRPNSMASDKITFVFQQYDNLDYNGNPVGINVNTSNNWYGATESIKSAIAIAKSSPYYSGNGGGGGVNYKSLRKRNAMGFAIDGGNGGANNQNVKLWTYASNNGNQQWQEISRGGGFYTYKKKNTNFVIDGDVGGSNNQNVKLWSEDPGNQNQHWKKVHMGGSFFRLEKRNAGGFSIDGDVGGNNNQNVKLWGSSNTNQNQHWSIE